MRVRATKAFSVVRNCQITDLQEGQEVDGDFARYLLESGAQVEPIDDDAHALLSQDDAPEPVEKTGDELDIDGKIDDVLAWVGDDPERALIAHDAEEAKGDKARPRLLTKLSEIVES